jgi:hypothetical protein
VADPRSCNSLPFSRKLTNCRLFFKKSNDCRQLVNFQKKIPQQSIYRQKSTVDFKAWCAAVCGSVRQCVAVCSSVRQCGSATVYGSVRQCAAVCGSVRQCVAVCGGVWQCARQCMCGSALYVYCTKSSLTIYLLLGCPYFTRSGGSEPCINRILVPTDQ